MKIIAIVKSKYREYFVFDEIPNPVHTRYCNDTIIGKSGCLYTCYGYGSCSDRWKAFGGREFDLNLSDGTVEHCYGQWWDKVTSRAVKELIINNKDRSLINVAANDIKHLTNCYVYCGFRAIESEIAEIRKQYTGKVYEYWEYENDVIKPILERIKSEYKALVTDRIFRAGFREVGKRKYRHSSGGVLKFIDTNHFFLKSNNCNNVSELDIPQRDRDILLSAFGKTVRNCCVKSNGEVYIENDRCINYLYQIGRSNKTP